MKAAILYYSSNQEDPAFEVKIVENLLRVRGGLPIISVTHKPMDLGKNICVGDVGASGFNMFRQVVIGLQATDADVIFSAESDCLYPPDYFQFMPPRLDLCYRNSNLYVMGNKRDYYWHKPGGATHAQAVGREFYLTRLMGLFHGAPQWSVAEKNFPKERWGREDVFKKEQVDYWETVNPVVQIKTGRGMRHYTVSARKDIGELPYWGEGIDIRREYCGWGAE